MRSERIVHQVTLRYLLKNRKRSLISLISISLMVILLTGVFIGKDTAIRFFTDIAEAERGKWHINVYDIDHAQYEKLTALPFVEETGVSSHLAVSGYAGSANAMKPYLDLRSYSKNSMDWMNIKVITGREPENDQEILLSEAVLTDGGTAAIGDRIMIRGIQRFITNSSSFQKVFPFQEIIMEPWETIEVSSGFPYYPDNPEITETAEPTGFEKEYTVVGFMEVPSFESPSSAVYTAITRSDEIPAGLFNLSMRVSEDDTDLYHSLNEIAPDQFEANNYVLIFHGQSTSHTINLIVIMMQIFLTALIIVIAAVLMNNVFALSYDDRLKYLGMLTSIGATAKQKRSSVYFEAAVLLAIALPIGLVCGLFVIKAAVSFMRPAAAAFMGLHLSDNVPVHLDVKLTSVLAVILFSILTVSVSALLPARKISKIGPVASIRGNENEKSGKPKKTVSYPSAERMLAAGFLHKEKRRSRTIVKALCAFMTVMTVLTYASNALIRMAGFKLRDTDAPVMKTFDSYEYFLYVKNDPVLFESLKDQLETTGGVEKQETVYDFASLAMTPYEYYSDEFRNAFRDVIMQYYPEGLSDEEYQEQYMDNPFWWTDFLAVEDEKFNEILQSLHAAPAETDHPQVILVKDGAVSTDYYGVWQRNASEYRYYEIQDMTVSQPGDVFVSTFGSTDIAFTVAAKADSSQLSDRFAFSGEKLTGILPLSQAESLISMDECSGAFRYYLFDGDENNRAFMNALTEIRNAESDDFLLMSHDTYLPETIQTSLKALIRVLLISFTVLASAVCFMNIFNSISGLIAYRRKTYAILKANGMTDRQLQKTLLLEAGFICLKSILYAAVISFVLCFAIRKMVRAAFGSFTIDIPYTAVILTVIVGVLMCLISGWYTYKKESDANLMEEIRKDSI